MSDQETPVNIESQIITETQAIARLKQGDLSGLETLVQHYQVKAVHAAVLFVHDRELGRRNRPKQLLSGCSENRPV